MNQFRYLWYLVVPFMLTSCYTRIWTVAPTVETVVPVKTVYTTHVTTHVPKQTTAQTITVTNYNADMSFYLDLHAVAAAYAEARSTREFEQLLNSSKYMINNLDLNRDGYVDYLRVIETRKGHYYAYLIQACLAPSVFQDVATLVSERRASTLYVEVVGDSYLYGHNYIVRPTFVKRPPMWDVYGYTNYSVWVSPYYYGAWPNYYTRPKTVYITHYQAYVKTYVTNHHYCHACDYPTHCFYNDYTHMTRPHNRNDYHHQHPEYAFDRRVSANGSGVSVRNAGELRAQTSREATTTTKPSSTQSGTSTRQPATQTTTTTTARKPATNTTTTTTTSTSTTRKPTTQTTTSTSTTRKPAVQTTTSTNTTRKPAVQTTIDSRVKKNGTTRTTIKQTDSSGKTTTVQRTTSTSRKPATTSTTSTARKPATTSTTSTSRKPATTSTTSTTTRR